MGNDDAQEKGLTKRIVMDLTRHLQRKFIRVFFDNFYTSVDLLEDLIVHGIYACRQLQVIVKTYLLNFSLKT